ncbi:MAG: GNAT family N-acetyltransferase [Deltaproteobacteria bacterium]|jgi:ribosomal protein S18 acetylase RimI-like enzyme|nr:GNAT family N-acetyltransferase [Deltaproteobacteria bacterium]
MVRIELRDANPEDAEFVAWVLLTSHRSHLPKGLWDFSISEDEPECLRYLAQLAVTPHPHFAHYSTFRVAEVDGQRAAALCGYFDEELGIPALGKGIAEADAATGRSEAESAAGFARAGSVMKVAPDHEAGTWVVEHVATRPEYRRRGLVDRLVAEMLDRGRERGASQADIGVIIGNDAAQRAYEKAGFRVLGEKRHADYEATYGSPGIRSMGRSI